MDTALYDALGQRQVSTMYKPLNQYHVVMEIDPRFQTSPDSLKDIYVRSTNGVEVPLSAVTKYDKGNTAQRVNHQGQFPSVTLSFNMAPGVALGDAVAAVDRATKEMILPATVHASFQERHRRFRRRWRINRI
jgi:multidrug efflux pump subunit AcrB